jgi:hypothetical protein
MCPYDFRQFHNPDFNCIFILILYISLIQVVIKL